MKQLSTRTIAIIALVAVAILAIGVFVVQDNTTNPPVIVVENEEGHENEGKKTMDQEFVTDVDMNVENWQVVENSLFTIKVPKEWYWRENGGGILMTNDPDYIRPESCVPRCLNDPEFPVRKDQVMLALDAWSPHNSYNREKENAGVIEFTQKKYIAKYEGDPKVECSLMQQDPNLKQSVVKCRNESEEKNRLFHEYLVVSESDAYLFIFITMRDTLINEKIFDIMMQSVVLKD